MSHLQKCVNDCSSLYVHKMKNVAELKWTVIFQLKDLDRQLKYIPQNNTASTFYLVSSFFNEAPLKEKKK